MWSRQQKLYKNIKQESSDSVLAAGAKDSDFCPQLSVMLVPGDLMHSAGLKEYCTHMLHIHTGKYSYTSNENKYIFKS